MAYFVSSRSIRKVLVGFALIFAWSMRFSAAGADDTKDVAGIEFFEKKIRPVLTEYCYRCHSSDAKKLKGNLLLDTRSGLRKGGHKGQIVTPGQPERSSLLKRLRHDEDEAGMPPEKLPAAVIADFEKWIAIGAPDPRTESTVEAKGIDWNNARKFWSFRLPVKPEPPKVEQTRWIKSPIDRFILAKLESEKLQPVPAASKRVLIRRATFDLTGLPPTVDQVDAFLKDESPDAFAKVVERLLQSPQYGERWGRYWLDVARFAEDQAHTFAVTPNTSAWRYRDWVIGALNGDMPYDRFIKLQIAADLIEKDDANRMQHLPALGFFGLGAQYYKNTDAAKAAADELDDRVDTLTRGFLGLTVSCARCHDHKFDPIPQIDYYSLAGIFSSCRLANQPLADKEKVKRFEEAQNEIKKLDSEVKNFLRDERTEQSLARVGELSKYLLAAWKVQQRTQNEAKAAIAEIVKSEKLDGGMLGRAVKMLEKSPAMAAFPKKTANEAEAKAYADMIQSDLADAIPKRNKGLDKAKTELLHQLFLADNAVFSVADAQVRSKLSDDKKQKLNKLSEVLAKAQKSDAAKALPLAHGLAEGTPADMKIFQRGNPAKLGDPAPRRFMKILAGDNPPLFVKGSGRLELADAIASKENPLTARVMVNRVWQNHFGRGLVGSPSNFGQLGERPTHPELLDYLACRFMESNWSLKALHRDIMLSAVYQLSSDRDDKNFVQDGDNRWLWRMPRRRLDIEAWRDSMLAVSGKLDATLGGPTVDLSAANNVRRTIYAKVSRHDLNYLLRLFDFPDANITSERRNETTVPQQQLFVINSPFVIEQAKALAARLQKEASTDEARVGLVYLLLYGRPVDAEEQRLALDFLSERDGAGEQAQNRLTRWERFAQVLLGSNEFMYVD